MSTVDIRSIRAPLLDTAREDLKGFFDRAFDGKKVIDGKDLKKLEDSMCGDYVEAMRTPAGAHFTVDQLVESYGTHFDNCVAKIVDAGSKTISDDQLWAIGDIDANLQVRLDGALDLMDMQAKAAAEVNKPRPPEDQKKLAQTIDAHRWDAAKPQNSLQVGRYYSLEQFSNDTGLQLPSGLLEMLQATQKKELESVARQISENGSEYNGTDLKVTAQDLVDDIDLGEYDDEIEAVPSGQDITFVREDDGEPVGAVFSYMFVEHGYESGVRVIWDARSRNVIAKVEEFASGDPAQWEYPQPSAPKVATEIQDASTGRFPIELGAGKVNTAACRKALAGEFGGSSASWKRQGGRPTVRAKIFRTFSNGEKCVVVVATNTQITSATEVSARPSSDQLKDGSWKKLVVETGVPGTRAKRAVPEDFPSALRFSDSGIGNILIHALNTDRPVAEGYMGGGSLLDYVLTDDELVLSFSNECDNMFTVAFGVAGLRDVAEGKAKTVSARASLEADELDLDEGESISAAVTAHVTNPPPARNRLVRKKVVRKKTPVRRR